MSSPVSYLDQAKIALMHLLNLLISGGLDERFTRANPKLPHSLVRLTLGWLFPMLDYVMTGDRRIRTRHQEFINTILANGLSVKELNLADGALRDQKVPFDPQVLPAFLLIAERLQPGFCEEAYSCLDDLIQAAVAWDGDKTPQDMDRAEQVLEPIRKHFELEAEPSSSHSPMAPGEALKELESLVGLEGVKREVRNSVNFARYTLNRKENGLPVPPVSMHMVFTGNPGTGKTTVARLIADIYRDIGLLRKGHLVETDRSGMIGQYLGQTPGLVREVVESAFGGVLFIDEAYALVKNAHETDYGHEAIATLLKLMEDHRDDLIVIVAGYTEEMQTFIDSNPGLKSRFTRYIQFDDYEPADLLRVFRRLCDRHELRFRAEAWHKSRQTIKNRWESRGDHYGNAREMRTFFEEVMQAHANRLSQIDNPSRDQLRTLTPEDIPG